ncbi:MAG: polysaccharide biosynthesis tyrosine autokinase, partial [Alphaproteobacteria bacterium]|nr:polysaccharide biosynthesis tyrosine autokinase [Alphaproteobacteria bacterium]
MLIAKPQFFSMPDTAKLEQPILEAIADPFFKNMDLRDATRLLKRRLQLIVGVMGACALLALLVSLMMTSQYRAEAVVMMDPRHPQGVALGSMMSGLPIDNTALRSEIDIILSGAVVNRVIAKLKLMEDEEIHPRRLLSKLNPLSWFWASRTPEEEAAYQHSLVVDNIAARLKVDNDGRTYSIRIFFNSKDPEKAQRIANTFADEYLVDQLEAKYEATTRSNKWLDERLGTLREQVQASEKAVQEFREKNNMIEIEGSTVAARQMQEINKQLTEARGQTSQAEARLRSIQSKIQAKGGVDSAADVLASPLIQRLREQEAEVRRREAELATRYGEMHPKMIDARAEYRDLQNKIAEEVHKVVQSMANELDIARAKEAQMETELNKLQSRAGVEMKESVALRQLEREAEANRSLYQDFLNRFKQTGEQQSMQITDSRIIARADLPTSPYFPQKWLFMLIGGLIGGVLGVLLAYLVEYFDRGFRSAVQLEEMTHLPVVGVVPSLEGVSARPPEDYVVDKPLSGYSEALRTVRTAIHFSNVDSPPKTVMVTSSVPGEGKTTFCLSLARSLAKAGNKILLVDADLRRPRVADITGLANLEGGLASLLAGDKSMAAILRRDPIVAGLDILPAASKAPNAQDLLGSHQMQKILREAASQYDLVIVDTPPILAVSDAAMVARVVDTSLFLVRWAATPRDTTVQALKQL